MNRLNEQEVLAGFKLMGLETESARAKFNCFSSNPEIEEEHQTFLKDNTSQISEAEDAELA